MNWFNRVVPTDDLAPPDVGWKPIKSGQYRARFVGVERLTNNKNWHAVAPQFVITQEGPYAGRKASGSITTELTPANDAAGEIAAKQLAALLVSTELVSGNGTGVDLGALFDGADDVTDEVHRLLQQATDAELMITIRSGPRRRKNKSTGKYEFHYTDGTTSMDRLPDKQPRIDEEVVGYAPLK